MIPLLIGAVVMVGMAIRDSSRENTDQKFDSRESHYDSKSFAQPSSRQHENWRTQHTPSVSLKRSTQTSLHHKLADELGYKKTIEVDNGRRILVAADTENGLREVERVARSQAKRRGKDAENIKAVYGHSGLYSDNDGSEVWGNAGSDYYNINTRLVQGRLADKVADHELRHTHGYSDEDECDQYAGF